MNLLKGLLEILHDLIIGDCWQIAAGVAVVLAASIALVRNGLVTTNSTSVVLGVVIMLISALIIFFEARKH